MKTGVAVGVAACVVTVALAGCSSSAAGSSTTTPGSSSRPTARSASQVCLDGIHLTPHDNVTVEKAALAPLGHVKQWILATDSSIVWSSFSSTLSHAPLTEQVAVCLYTQKDGTFFTPPAGTNDTPAPAEAFIAVVRQNGEQTGFLFGAKAVLAAQFPRSL